jgi:hypothetical protein
MTDEEGAMPERYLENHSAWDAYFHERHQLELDAYDNAPPPPARLNADGRRRWWSAPRRNLATVLDHIQAGNSAVLLMPLWTSASFSWRREGSYWMPRRRAFTVEG